MLNTVIQYINQIPDGFVREALRNIILEVADRLSSQAMNSAGLVIKAGGGVLAKTGGSVTYLLANGKIVSINAATDMPALTGLVITANKFNVACFFVDSAGTTSVLFGKEGATAALVQFPQFPQKKALIGVLLITHSATFTGNTTPLDTATTVYISPTGAINPTTLLG